MLKFFKRLNELYGWLVIAVFGLVVLIGAWQMYDNYYMFSHSLDESILQYKPDPNDPSAAANSPIGDDMVGWLTIDDTNIDYPVMQGSDNSKYLNTDPFGEYSLSGSIFLDSRCSPDFSDEYSVIYGHHMDYGKMFGALDDFLNEEYLRSHTTGTLMVGRNAEKVYDLEVFASARVSAREKIVFDSLIELITHQTATSAGLTLYVDEGSEVTRWKFRLTDGDKYKLSADTDEGVKYLAVSADGLVLTGSEDSTAEFKVTPDSNGRIQLSSGGKYVAFYSADDNGNTVTWFALADSSDSNTWLNLINYAELKESDLITYSADRISVSDAVNGQKVIVYTRIWDDEALKYDMYAIDHIGTLYPCYASGGKILWLGDGTGSLEWTFTEYYDAVTKEPNYYYELYNTYSEKYIAPQVSSDQVLSGSTIGINMQGRRNGEFFSEIVAWDNTKYAYVGIKPNDEKTRIIPCSQSAAMPF